MFEDFEFNPMAAGVGIVGGVVSLIVSSQVQVNIIFRILTFVLATIVCYFMGSKIFGG